METKQTPELVQHFLDALENPAKRLTAWEQNFVESVSNQFDIRGSLSDRQFEILERIYAEKTA